MKYLIDKPYPKIENIQENPKYATMILANIGGLYSEMNATSLYFYNHIILKKVWPELSEAMNQISMVEMHHLEIFAQLAYDLGADPRLWDCQQGYLEYWSPGYNVYPCQIQSLLENALIQEEKAIDIYRHQINCINNKTIKDILSRIIEDEQFHIKIFLSFLEEYKKRL